VAVTANVEKIIEEVAHGMLAGRKAAIHTVLDVEGIIPEALARVRTTRFGRTRLAGGSIISVHAVAGNHSLAMHAQLTGICAGRATAAIGSMETFVS
jgi:hypothetical protein